MHIPTNQSIIKNMSFRNNFYRKVNIGDNFWRTSYRRENECKKQQTLVYKISISKSGMVSCIAPRAQLSQRTEQSSIRYEVYMERNGISNDMVEGDLYLAFIT
jgi:hypothetical protein